MPALRNTKANGSAKANGIVHRGGSSSSHNNGHNSMEEARYLEKKLILLEENGVETQPRRKTQATNGFDANNNSQEETFADTFTVNPGKHQDEPVAVFGGRDEATSIGQSARDQFAVALLRLQTDLEATNRRLTDVEGKLDKGLQQQSGQRQEAARKEAAKGSGALSTNVTNILYLTWPVLVFLAMRAIERRVQAAKMA